MFGNNFYHGLMQKYVVLFGTLFNDLQISRYDATNSLEQVSKIPLNYGPKESWMARVEADPDIDRPYSILLPRMAYEMTDVRYNPDNKLNTMQRFAGPISITNTNKVAYNSVNMPVPYDITFVLTIMSKTVEDGLKILEQIVPYFTPDWTVTAELLEHMPGYKQDIPITLTDLRYTDTYDQAFEKRRMITWDLTFVMKANLYGPINKAKVIKIAKINLYANGIEDTHVDERVTVRPGLTANGEPTTDEAQSVPYLQIEETDNYAYIVKVESDL